MTTVALVQDRVRRSGRTRALRSMAATLNADGVVPTLLTFSPPADARAALDGLEVDVRRAREPWWAKSYTARQLAIARAARPLAGTHDVLISHDAAVQPLADLPNAVHYHAFPPQGFRRYDARYRAAPRRQASWLIDRATDGDWATPDRTIRGRVWANSAFTAGVSRELYGPIDIDVVLAPARLPSTPIDLARPRRRLVVALGGLRVDKRQVEFLELAATIPEAVFVAVGGPDDHRYAARCAAVADALPNAFVSSGLDDGAVEDLMSSAAVFCHLKEWEHLGLATAEAMAHGCVPVVHDSGGQREVVPVADLRFDSLDEASTIVGKALEGGFDEHRAPLAVHAESFGEEAFRSRFSAALDTVLGVRR